MMQTCAFLSTRSSGRQQQPWDREKPGTHRCVPRGAIKPHHRVGGSSADGHGSDIEDSWNEAQNGCDSRERERERERGGGERESQDERRETGRRDESR